MSHFTVLVIGNNPEKQLSPYNEGLEMPRYAVQEVSEEDKQSFIEHYAKKSAKNGKINLVTTFDDLYKKYGQDWNGGFWEKHSDGKWWEYSTRNPQAKWDWYLLGGRWTGFFKLKPRKLLGTTQVFDAFLGFTAAEMENFVSIYSTSEKKFAKIASKYDGKGVDLLRKVKELSETPYPAHTLGEPGLMTEPGKKGYADSAYKKDIDFEAMKNAAATKAAERYDKVMSFISDLPESKPWNEVLAENKNNIEKAREIYWKQERCAKFNNDKALFEIAHSPDEFLVQRDEYILNARSNAISTFAVVKDGKWYEKGNMGWWGIVTDKKEGDEWNKQFSSLIDSVPDDVLLSVYDCHI